MIIERLFNGFWKFIQFLPDTQFKFDAPNINHPTLYMYTYCVSTYVDCGQNVYTICGHFT